MKSLSLMSRVAKRPKPASGIEDFPILISFKNKKLTYSV
jgi:hypothetical protein